MMYTLLTGHCCVQNVLGIIVSMDQCTVCLYSRGPSLLYSTRTSTNFARVCFVSKTWA